MDEPECLNEIHEEDTQFFNRSAEEVVAHCLHQGEDAEARRDGDHQGPGGLQGLCLLWLDFTQKRLQEGVTSVNLES